MQKNNILILGLGISGNRALELIMYCDKYTDCNLYATDIDISVLNKCSNNYKYKSINFIKQSDIVNFNFSDVICSPGVNIKKSNLKEIIYLRNSKVNFITDLSIINECTNFKMSIGITGTNGKTTACTLLYKLLDDSFVTGNIGVSQELQNYKITDALKKETIIYEISSYQLEKDLNLNLSVALLLNINEQQGHEEFHGDFDKYLASKLNIFNNSKISILNEEYRDLIKKYSKKDNFIYFSSKKILQKGFSFVDDCIYINGKFLIKIEIAYSKKTDTSNIAAIIAILFSIYDENKAINILQTFAKINQIPLKYRCDEFIYSANNAIIFVNNSKATNIAALDFTLKKYESLNNSEIFLLICGVCKNDSILEHILNITQNVKFTYMFGGVAEKYQIYKNKKKSIRVRANMFDACESALHDALLFNNKSGKKCYIILSPGLQSFDQFKNFEQRGEEFFNYIENLS